MLTRLYTEYTAATVNILSVKKKIVQSSYRAALYASIFFTRADRIVGLYAILPFWMD